MGFSGHGYHDGEHKDHFGIEKNRRRMWLMCWLYPVGLFEMLLTGFHVDGLIFGLLARLEKECVWLLTRLTDH